VKGGKAKGKRKVEEIDVREAMGFLPSGAVVDSRREYFSRAVATIEHGERRVREAYEWLEAGLRKKDPWVMEVYAMVMAMRDPYDHLVRFHERRHVVSGVVQPPPGLAGLRR
jgi:erythromycin esterase-like protein